MSLTSRVLAGLVLGLAAGAVVAALQHPALLALVPIVEPVGVLWLNALRMTVVPLVVSLLVTGIAEASAVAAAGRVGGRTLAVVAIMLTAAGIYGAIATPLLLAWFPIAPGTETALGEMLGGSTARAEAVPGFAEWITGLVPANPIEAAASGAMLPLVVFSLLFGLAAARINPVSRETLLDFFRALREAMMVIVHWVLLLAPIGVFALVFPVGAGAGLAALGALGHYVVLLSSLCIIATILVYPAAAVFSRVPLRKFASAVAPAQAIAFSTRSSLASLPAMLEGVQRHLTLPPPVTGLVLPLAVSLMRITSPIVNLASALFAAALLRMDLTPLQIATGALVAILASLGSVGLPGQVSFFATKAPVFFAMGVPVEVLGLMLAVEVIPDTFMTVGNVTGHVAATAVVARGVEPASVAPPAPEEAARPPVERNE